MQVAKDDWTPLFEFLKSKVSAAATHELMFQAINEIRFITQSNFGVDGIARPEAWAILNADYARKMKKGNRTPNLILKGDLIKGFRTETTSTTASLTNVVEYADEHQFGAEYKSLPARPYYPVTADGTDLTAFAKDRLQEVMEKHFQG